MHSHRLKPLVSTSMVYMFSSLYSIHLRVSHFIPPSDISSAFTAGHCHPTERSLIIVAAKGVERTGIKRDRYAVSTSMVYMSSLLYPIHLHVSHFIPLSDISSAFTVGHCHLEDTIVKLTKLSNDPELDCVFRSIHRFVQQRLSSTTRDTPTGNEEANFLDSLNRRALLFHDLQLKLRNEIAAAKIKWLRK